MRADELATAAKKKIFEKPKRHKEIAYPDSKATLFINNKIISKRYERAMARAWTTSDLRYYLEHKNSWTTDTCDKIDWFAFGRGITRLKLHQQQWTVKFIHRWLPLLSEKRQNKITIICPMCNISEETTDHFMKCQDNEVKLIHIANDISKLLDKHEVDPYLRTLIRRAFLHESNEIKELRQLCNFPVDTYVPLIEEQKKRTLNQ